MADARTEQSVGTTAQVTATTELSAPELPLPILLPARPAAEATLAARRSLSMSFPAQSQHLPPRPVLMSVKVLFSRTPVAAMVASVGTMG